MPASVRSLFHQPIVTAVAIFTLGLGIGGNTAMFTIVNAVLLKPLPFQRPADIVALTERAAKFPSLSASWQNYSDWRDQSRSYTELAAYRPLNVTITGGDQPERVPAKMLTAGLLPMLGVTPTLGRPFTRDDDRPGAAPVVLISQGLWARRYHSAASAVGATMIADNVPRTVVGVLPASFELVQPADVYLPMGPWAATLPDDRSWHPGIFPIGRLAPGVTLEQARKEADALGSRLATQYAATNIALGINVKPFQEQIVQNVRPALLLLLGAVALVLLIACANVANLLLARAVTRRRELAVRAALGASRWTIVRQLLSENVVLALLGGALGLLLAQWGVESLVAVAGPTLPGAEQVQVDGQVLVFSLVISVLAGLLSGLAPAFTASRLDLRETLNEETRGGSGSSRGGRLRASLVVAEVALATTLLLGAGLLLRSFARLQSMPAGFETSRLLVADLPLSPQAYATNTQRGRFAEELLRRAESLPGVKAAALTTAVPMSGPGGLLHFNIFGRPPKGPEDYVLAGYRAVSSDYQRTLGVPLVAGRFFEPRDREGSPSVVVINQAFARAFFNGRNPIGQRLQVGATPEESVPWMEVVGVIADVRQSLEADAPAEMFVPYLQGAPDPVLGGMFRNVSVLLRTEREPQLLGVALRQSVAEVDHDQPVVKLRTMDEAIGTTVAAPRFRTLLIGLFAGGALLLAAIGVYGVMAYGVSQRRQEIGVRLALGAGGGDVVRLVVGDALRLTVIGAVLGMAGGVAAGRLIRGFLFQTTTSDPVTLVAVPLLLVLTALLAAGVPALRATRVEPRELTH